MRGLLVALAGLAAIAVCGPATAAGEEVAGPAGYPAGSIVIVNSERRLYYILGGGRALRYPVAVGKLTELWTGRSFVSMKQVDPRWIPIDGGDEVEGGDPANPLGKRALYLDWSLLRIHGTPSRKSVGSAVSSGCIRMLSEDVIELYDRVHLGAPVFAIATPKDTGQFADAKIGSRVYANPEARREAKQAEQDAEDRRERQATQGRRAERRTAAR